jgi:hypothetical protein
MKWARFRGFRIMVNFSGEFKVGYPGFLSIVKMKKFRMIGAREFMEIMIIIIIRLVLMRIIIRMNIIIMVIIGGGFFFFENRTIFFFIVSSKLIEIWWEILLKDIFTFT